MLNAKNSKPNNNNQIKKQLEQVLQANEREQEKMRKKSNEKQLQETNAGQRLTLLAFSKYFL